MVDNVDPDGVAISINDKFSALQPLLSDICIYRVPEILRSLNEDAYRPWVVSIGPFHHDDAKLKPMQEHKLRYLRSLLQRNKHKNIGHYVQLVRDRLEDIRNCYSQQIELDDDTFVEMVLLDAAFIVVLLRDENIEYESNEVDFIGINRYLVGQIYRDLILEENQLPFFIVNDIYNSVYPDAVEDGFPFILVAKVLVVWINNCEQPIEYMAENTEIKHFVDLLRLYCSPSTPETKPNDSENTNGITSPPSVTELYEAGLKFQVSTSENFLDISYNNGVLQMPRLNLGDESETIFRNLLVYEQLNPSRKRYISDYISFLDDLINTSKDVDILVQKGIIGNGLGSSKEATKLINSLNIHITAPGHNFYYSGVCSSLNKYMSSKWHKWRAILTHKYFSHPWAVVSVIYAIVLLILTILSVLTGFIQIS